MSKKRTALLILVLVGGTVLLGLLRKKSSPADVASSKDPDRSKVVGSSGPPSDRMTREATSAGQSEAHLRKRIAPSVADATRDYLEQKKADPLYDWKRPLVFYGKAVDEAGRPVVGANIRFEWNTLNNSNEVQSATEDRESDAQGSFFLAGRTGNPLSVTVSKEGYYTPTAENLRTFQYAVPYEALFTPDPANPVVYHLHKKGAAEPLIHVQKLFGFRVNGPVQYLDLLQSKNSLAPPGDLTVRFTRGAITPENKYNWAVAIGVPDGGILETNQVFTFTAPADGYQPALEIRYTTNSPGWVAQAKRSFFLKSRNGGVFGRIEATFIPFYQDNAAIDLEYFANPNASRNLEFDPAKEIKLSQ